MTPSTGTGRIAWGLSLAGVAVLWFIGNAIGDIGALQDTPATLVVLALLVGLIGFAAPAGVLIVGLVLLRSGLSERRNYREWLAGPWPDAALPSLEQLRWSPETPEASAD